MVIQNRDDPKRIEKYTNILEIVDENVNIMKHLTSRYEKVNKEIERIENEYSPIYLSNLINMRETLKESMEIVAKDNDAIRGDVLKKLDKIIERSNHVNFTIEI